MTLRGLGFPEPARAHFNARAEELVLQLGPIEQPPEAPRRKAGLALQIPVHAFGADDGSTIAAVGLVNGFGMETARGFDAQGDLVGLQGEAMVIALRLLQKLSARPECNAILSETFLRKALFSWLEGRFKREIPGDVTFLGFLETQAAKSVRNRRVVMAIEYLDLDCGFDLGRVSFDFFREDAFDSIDRTRLAHWVPATPEMAILADELRRKYQGKAYCSIRLEGEPERCLERAREEIDKALAILRCFSPAVFVPQAPSYFGRSGNAHVPELDCFLFETVPEGAGQREVFAEQISRADESRLPHWRIARGDLDRFEKAGLFKAAELLVNPSRSELQERLLVCFELFARGIACARFEERLVFALVSLESLLVRDGSEPIEHNLAIRTAFLTERDREKRRAVMATMKEAYAARSRFLHHGKASSDEAGFADHFQHIVWTVLRNVLYRPERTKGELLQAIEDAMLSAQ